MEISARDQAQTHFHPSDRVKVNVGGRHFETTITTLQSAGPESLLASLLSTSPLFFDRDPEVFSALLSLLRTNHLPSSILRRFSRKELLHEADFYGLSTYLLSSLSPPTLSGIDASTVSNLIPDSDPVVSAFSTSSDGSVWLTHGGQISTYDSVLAHSSTIRTHLDLISSICRISPTIAAVASPNLAGVHFYDVYNSSGGGELLESGLWIDPTDPRTHKSRVLALATVDSSASYDSTLFASFECWHSENAVLAFDRETLKVVSELTRQSGNSSKYSAPRKLKWVPELGILVGSSVTAGAFGCSGYIRLWDPRSSKVVWETSEPGSGRSSRFGDPLADVDVDQESSRLVKVCSSSGDLGMADMRMLGDDPWVYVEDPNPVLKTTTGGSGYLASVVHCYGGQVFVGKDSDLEVWDRVGGEIKTESDSGERKKEGLSFGEYKRNYVDGLREEGEERRGYIRTVEGGGNRLFVCREDVEGIEVWETSNISGLQSLTTM